MKSRSRGFTLIELLVTLSVIGILIGLLMPAIQSSRESARKLRCQSQLRQLGLGLHNYHEAHAILPPGSLSVGPAFIPFSGWGWGAMILPQIEQSTIYAQIDFDIHTAEGANRAVLNHRIPFLLCPSDSSPTAITSRDPNGTTFPVAAGSYAGISSMLSSLSDVRFRDVTDGLSNTLMVGETKYIARPDGSESTASWIGVVSFKTSAIGDSRPHAGFSPNTPPTRGFFDSQHVGGTQYTLGDGHVRFISDNIDRDTYLALATRNGGERVSF